MSSEELFAKGLQIRREAGIKCGQEGRWLTCWRRPVRDYEQRIDISEAMIHVALGSLLLRRICH